MTGGTAFGDWRGLRRALGLSQHDMAQLLAMTDDGYRKLETRNRRAHAAAVILFRTHLLAEPELRRRLDTARYSYPWPRDLEAVGGAR